MDSTSSSNESDQSFQNSISRLYVCTTLQGKMTGRMRASADGSRIRDPIDEKINFKCVASTQKRLLNDSDQTIYTRHLYVSTNNIPIPVVFTGGGQSGLSVFLQLKCGNKKPTCNLSSDYDAGYNHCTLYFDCLEDHPLDLVISNSLDWQYNGWVDAHFTNPLPKDPEITPMTMSDILGMCGNEQPL